MHGLVAKSLADVDISARKQKWSCCKHRRETARYDPAEAQWEADHVGEHDDGKFALFGAGLIDRGPFFSAAPGSAARGASCE